MTFYDFSENLVGLRDMTRKTIVTYNADVSTFLGRTNFYPKKWFYFAYSTGAVFTY